MQPFKYNPNFNSGQFRHRITFQQSIESEDELGQKSREWEDVTSAWAMIKTLKGREYFQAAATQSETTSRFIIHYREGINGSMRIKYDDRIFDIIEPPINDDEMNKTLTIIAKEVRQLANIKIDNLAKEIAKQVALYTDDVEKKVRRAENKVTKVAVEKLQAFKTKRDTGKYAAGWTRKRDKDGGVVIYNKTHPGLAHLLEHGHAQRGGGRVAGKAHIRPVEESAVEEFEKLVEKAIKS